MIIIRITKQQYIDAGQFKSNQKLIFNQRPLHRQFYPRKIQQKIKLNHQIRF